MKIYKDTSELNQHQRMRGDFKILWPIIKDALNKKLWLYNKLSGEWYTPEEFLNEYQAKQMNNYMVDTLARNVIVRNPEDGNAAYHKEIQKKAEQYEKDIAELRNKGQAFLNKVIQYYQKKLNQQ